MNTIHVLFPKVRAEIIRLLFADASASYHLRKLSRLSHLALGTLQTEVQKLAKAELLLTRRDGNRLYFRANPDHPVFPELHGLALKTTGLHSQLEDALHGLEGLELAFVFGSMATSAEGASSDVDLFVIGSIGLRKLAPRLRTVTTRLQREINPYTISTESLREKVTAGDAFIQNVLNAPKLWIKGNDDELGKLI